MKSFAPGLVALVLLTGAGLGVYSWLNSNHKEAQPSPVISSLAPLTAQSPVNHYPVPPESELTGSSAHASKPVTGIDESDQSVEEMLGELIGKGRFESLFHPKDIVRRIVVTVENATKHNQISQEFSPFSPLERGFRLEGKGQEQTISPSNFERYKPYVDLAQTVDAEGLVNIYVHFYPLFQSAYQDLGTRGYFNDRLIQAIDTLLNTPEVEGPIKVTRVSVHKIYRYADDQLEELPAMQKIIIRMGTKNASVIKKKLRELRALLIHLDKKKKK